MKTANIRKDHDDICIIEDVKVEELHKMKTYKNKQI